MEETGHARTTARAAVGGKCKIFLLLLAFELIGAGFAGPAWSQSSGGPDRDARHEYRWALRSNLLFDAAGAPNLETEFALDDHFSVLVGITYADWSVDGLYASQTLHGGVEGRYRFKPLTGWYAGIYAMVGGRYDVRWKDGYQGDGFWSAGLSAGYSIPLSRRLNLEFSLAGGYFFTPEVRHYHRPENGHLLWQRTRYNVGRISLTRVAVDLVWLFGKRR
jgi:hypothetical protein